MASGNIQTLKDNIKKRIYENADQKITGTVLQEVLLDMSDTLNNVATSSLTVDSQLNGTSTNPIQNKPVAEKFATLDNTITQIEQKADDAASKADNALTKAETAITQAQQNTQSITNLKQDIDKITGGAFTVDKALNKTSENAIANKPVAEKFETLDTTIADVGKKADDALNKATTADKNASDALTKAETAISKSEQNSQSITNLRTDVDNLVAGTVTIDQTLNKTSTNAVANKPVAEKFETLDTTISNVSKKADDAASKADQAIKKAEDAATKADDASKKADQATQKAEDAATKADQATQKAEEAVTQLSDLHVIMSETEWNALAEKDRDPKKIYLIYN